MRIFVLALDGVFDLGLSSVLDTLRAAEELAPALEPSATRPAPAIEVTLVGLRRRVRTAQGLGVPVRALAGAGRPDALIVPGLGAKTPGALVERLAQRDATQAAGVLREFAQEGVRLAAACTGTFVLAQGGLLDEHRATTTWWLSPLFRQRHPRVALDESRMLVASGNFVTAGAALAHVDLALGLVRGMSPALAALAARYLLVEPRASQAVFIIPDHLAHADPLVERFEAWARGRLAQGFSLAAAAHATGASGRTLARRLNAALGKSPLAYFQDLRVQHAVHLLQTTAASVEQIAPQIGYRDGVTLRTLLRRKLGRGVKELRAAP